MTALAEAALGLLDGPQSEIAAAEAGMPSGTQTWTHRRKLASGMDFRITCTGPDLPKTIPAETVLPSDIPKDPKWVGTYRLVIAAPVVAFDLSWKAGAPLRIMTFSRGDWEDGLLSNTA